MREVLRRERETELAKWETSLVAIGAFLGAKPEGCAQMVISLKRELRKFVNHDTFSAEQALQNVRVKLRDLERDRRMLQRIEEL